MFNKLFKIFEDAGEELFIVGGAVRDKILHDNKHYDNPLEKINDTFVPNDVDFATSALPEKIMRVLKENNLKVIPIGLEFGTIQTIIDGMKIEITTYRCKESYLKGSRKPKVTFGKSLEEDLSRRDFTMNAIAMDKDGRYIDPFGGKCDLACGRIQTPIAPRESFMDDPLRMLRAARFEARGYGKITWDVDLAMTEVAHTIDSVSSERIFDEVNKLLTSEDPAAGLNVLKRTGLIEEIFPELQEVIDFKNDQGKWHSKQLWPHVLGVVSNVPPVSILRWAALFHDVAKPQCYSVDETGVHFFMHEYKGFAKWLDIAQRLRLPKKFRDDVGFLIEQHMRLNLLTAQGANKKTLRRLMRDAGEHLDRMFILSAADITSGNENRVTEGKKRLAELRIRILDIQKESDVVRLELPSKLGNKIMNELGLKEGIELGNIMKQLKQQLIDGDLDLNSDFIESAKEILNGKVL